MRRRIATALTELILISLSVLWPLSLTAQDDSTPPPYQSDAEVQIALYPKGMDDGTRFEVTANPGETVETNATIANRGGAPIELVTYVGNIVPIANGGIKMMPRGSTLTESASWIEYPTEEFELKSGEEIERTIRVTVPEGTPPGQYVNAIALETLNPVNGSESATFRQFIRKVVSIYITVPGEVVVAFDFGEPEVLVSNGRSGLQIPVTNSGNTRIDLEGTVKIVDGSGNAIHEGDVKLAPIYMTQQTSIQIPFAAVPPAGDYHLSYTFTDRNSTVTVSTESLAISVPEDTSALAQSPVAFENVLLEPNANPIVFANVSIDIKLTESLYKSTRLTMTVYRDGEFVEDFVLSENLALNPGSTTVTQRYLPATGWESGTYSFSLKLESTESGQSSLILDEQDVATLEVP